MIYLQDNIHPTHQLIEEHTMITRTNLQQLLKALGFNQEHEIWKKKYGTDSTNTIRVDLKSKRIKYPKTLKVNGQQVTNFGSPENFVVLECVDRLLNKGYRPEHLELEKTWQLGHQAKSGRADICIYDPSGLNVTTIIECKTAGQEYSKALKQLKNDGGQLFSYRQQEGSTQWLVLYASDYNTEDERIVYTSETVATFDDPQLVEQAEANSTIKLFSTAPTASALFEVWKDTYGKHLLGDLVFASEATAYNREVTPLRKKDLMDFEANNNIINQFEEIVRHNNVSDKENAFNRLIALFICKLVDEEKKSENDIMEFQYRIGSDTYATLQDRLQHLHKVGMEEFMKEKIYYVPTDYAETLFSTFSSSQRKHAISNLENTLKILKFYANNDFAFIEVHNEELFLKNGKILVEVVQLFERYRIVYTNKHQFLGDLFEQLLNNGVKQNEGQYFTPIPITRFIWDALPVKSIIERTDSHKYPKVIDYACGAGHFLTEAVEAINTFTTSNNNNSWVEKHIVGIEKDYRLARVSKVSLFMNGAGGANIIFGDGLEGSSDPLLENESFDILVANPPYSVKAFKQHLDLKGNDYAILHEIKDQGNEIELLFVERAVQLLKPGGVAAIILPQSFLRNSSAAYIKARQIMLQNFFIRAVVTLGSQTFSATGTNTVIVFLEKYTQSPSPIELIQDSIDAIFSDSQMSSWQDDVLHDSYLEHIDVDPQLYNDAIIERSLTLDELDSVDHFKPYIKAFKSSATFRRLTKTKKYSAASDIERTAMVRDAFYPNVIDLERKKLLYFGLTRTQSTVIINSPNKTSEQAAFLGYSWSGRRGSEGIHISQPGGELYDDGDRESLGTAAAAIRSAFSNSPLLSEKCRRYSMIAQTADILDFSRHHFNTELTTSPNRKIEVDTIYPLRALANFPGIEIQIGTPLTKEDASNGTIMVVAGGRNYAYLTSTSNRLANIITISASGANAGYVNFWSEEIFASDCITVRSTTYTETKWLYYYLKFIEPQIITVLQRGSSQPHVYVSDIERIFVPILEPNQLNMTVNACSKFDAEAHEVGREVKRLRATIRALFDELSRKADEEGTTFKLGDNSHFSLHIGRRVLLDELIPEGTVPVYSANVFEPVGYLDHPLLTDFSSDSVLWGIDGDWMVNYIAAGQPFFNTDHCGVLRATSDLVHPRFLAYLLESVGQRAGFSRTNRASIDRIEGLSIRVPSRFIQDEVIDDVLDLDRRLREKLDCLRSLETKRNAYIQDVLRH